MKALLFLGVSAALVLGGCAAPSQNGMVRDGASGLQYGSVIERNIFVDASQFRNRTIKVTTRNTSGDQAYHLAPFTADLNLAVERKGYVPTTNDRFGIRLDVNVLYSGHIQKNMGSEYAFLGAAAGGISGYRSNARAGTAAGLLVGSTIGGVIGSNVTDDTYVVVVEVSIGVTDSPGVEQKEKVITFSSSPPLQAESSRGFSPFREVLRTKIAVYGGGTNVSQAQIAEQVRRRLVSIVGDVI